MFTGLIETRGTLTGMSRAEQSVELSVRAEMDDFTAPVGASVAIDGVCLTVEKIAGKVLFFTAVSETLNHSTLGTAAAGRVVNLERALRVSDRLDGHIVLGHVDGIGRIVDDTRVGVSLVRTILIPESLQMFCALKGSIAIDGVSLTISGLGAETVSVSLVPHSLSHTTMNLRKPGDRVNVECDVLSRYVHRLAQFATGTGEAGHLISLLERGGF